jgi:Secretion system C-terminal sorting domain/SprB repeat
MQDKNKTLLLLKTKKQKKMKKLILIALAFAGLNATAAVTIGIKPVFEQPKCNGASTGKISLVLEGGTSPYYYHWSTDQPGHYGPATLNNLSAGTYTVTVYDAQGDSGTYTIHLGQPNPIQVYPSGQSQNVTVHGGNDGAIGILVDGGTPNYSFVWSNNATTQDIYNLSAGTYTVTVTDGFGCTTTSSQTVSQPNSIQQGHTPQLPVGLHIVHANEPSNSNADTKMDKISSNDNAASDNNISVYPNPASNFVNLNMEAAANSQVTFYNAAGQVVLQKMTEGSQNRIDISNLAKGDYLVAINNENGTTTKTIAVVK